ncbi:hypothetical protein EJ05DRAFT_501361 [Pseudovirgaria hyperparasitica]|uniref:RNA-dependent RNA polymerase n=1 Tax=Pseudovirgaria hyperparasitica TaxID=470096 RepID=A0A6A6W5G9_9PEZI|nr:uncharacterized protein EJ05DRAFT_501361 [Pseudovirgaria hyperparasitica]KAF2756807.1 hypothetical protein EJ05DRAFT_501361 [Pseudovirgaria hyperparasitica]
MTANLKLNTPRKRDHEEVNHFVEKFKTAFKLELPTRSETWSPQSNNSLGGKSSSEEKCVNLIKFIYYKRRKTLEDILQLQARPDLQQSERTKLLASKLQLAYDEIRTPGKPSRSEDRAIHSLTKQHEHAFDLRQPNFEGIRSGLQSNTTVLIERLERKSEHLTAIDIIPTTPPSSEESDFETAPESPTPACHGSPRFPRPYSPVEYPDLSPSRKRCSEDPVEHSYSEKFTRTTNGRRSSSPQRSEIPTSNVTSFASATPAITSFITSFTSNGTNDTEITIPPRSLATDQSRFDNEAIFADIDLREQAHLQPKPPLASSMGDLELNLLLSPSAADDTSPIDGDRPLESALEPHYIRNLYKQNLFVDTISDKFGFLDFLTHFECTRAALVNKLPPDEVIAKFSTEVPIAWDSFWTRIEGLPKRVSRGPKTLWPCSSEEPGQYTLKGNVIFNSRNERSLCRLELEPPVKEISCRFQRVFGSDRFLYITFPTSRGMPKGLGMYEDKFVTRFKEWLRTNHSFAGRVWRAVHLQETKTSKTARLKNEASKYRIILFAMSGCGILPRMPQQLLGSIAGKRPPMHAEMNLFDLINWFMPLSLNNDKNYLKAFARLDLGFSRTIPLLVFKPSQVKFIPDIKADGTPECTAFNDQKLDWSPRPKPGMDMTDGCARISSEAARQIWKLANESGPVPSAFQARIGGAKGVWFVDGSTDRVEDTDVWIEIRPSQLKFKAHLRDSSDKTFDKDRLTFEMVTYSRPLQPAALYQGFLPILTDRGVSVEYITRTLKHSMDLQRQTILDILKSPDDSGLLLQKWIEDTCGTYMDHNGETSIQAGFYSSHTECVKAMIGAGFKPTEFKHLANLAQSIIFPNLLDTAKYFRLPVAKSTIAIGIVDPYMVLEPGEIFIQFRKPFHDISTGQSRTSFEKTEALVARNPALRRSDLQKVRIVSKEKLRHLYDVVVFPCKGRHALANKLQGGDYDGDTFWICWEEDFTNFFMNAPAPVENPTPADYEISVDQRSLKEVMRKEHSVSHFIREAFDFRLKQNLLGVVTLTHEKLCYAEGTIRSPKTEVLCDIHDLLVDCMKNGYSYDNGRFNRLKKSFGDIKLNESSSDPAYKRAMKHIAQSKWNSKLIPEIMSHKNQHVKNVNDDLFFELMIPHIEETILQVSNILQKAKAEDVALSKPYDDERYRASRSESNDKVMQIEIKHIDGRLGKILEYWNSIMTKDMDTKDEIGACIKECFDGYRNVYPINKEDRVVSRLLRPVASGAPSEWSLLKASALFIRCLGKINKSQSLAFRMAGLELCYIKAVSSGRTRFLEQKMWMSLKPRKVASNRVVDESIDERADAVQDVCDDEALEAIT